MQALRAFNNFTIPFNSGWPIHEASYLTNGKPRIFWRGYGWWSYKTTGPKAWSEVEIPDPPKEPDNRFEWNNEAYAKWYPEWVAYAKEYGLSVAARGTICCEATIDRYTLAKYTQRDRYPPDALTVPVKTLLGLDPLIFDTLPMFLMNAPYSLDICKLLDRLMKIHGVDHDRWNNEVDQSAEQWIAEKYGDKAAAAVKALLHWQPDQYQEARYRAVIEDIYNQQREAMATCKSVKS